MATVKWKNELAGVSYERDTERLSFINNSVIIGNTGNLVTVVIDGIQYRFTVGTDIIYFNDVLFAGTGAQAHTKLRDEVFNAA